ncbi:MAG TPA: cupin-like domain-containing protein [Rhodanobacteraceae bacterium]
MTGPMAIEEFVGDASSLRVAEIVARDRPLVMRGLVADWPLVRKAHESDTAFAKYLANHDSGAPVDVLLLPSEADGVVGYNADMSGFNYEHHRVSVTMGLSRLARYSHEQTGTGLAIQSALVAQCLPGLLADHALPLLDASVAPRIWIGNKVTTPAHFDAMYNIACVVCGARRFTLFPPEQVANLYIGPPDYAPTGSAISVARVDRPDDPRFPRLREALDAARVAELQPGDAIYIPPLWWHNVDSLRQLNALVNYWWKPSRKDGYISGHELAAFYHCILAFRALPSAQRKGWSKLLDYYVFDDSEALHRMPAEHQGILRRPPDPSLVKQLCQQIRDTLDHADGAHASKGA